MTISDIRQIKTPASVFRIPSLVVSHTHTEGENNTSVTLLQLVNIFDKMASTCLRLNCEVWNESQNSSTQTVTTVVVVTSPWFCRPLRNLESLIKAKSRWKRAFTSCGLLSAVNPHVMTQHHTVPWNYFTQSTSVNICIHCLFLNCLCPQLVLMVLLALRQTAGNNIFSKSCVQKEPLNS